MLESVFLHVLDGLLREFGREQELAGALAFGDHQVGLRAAQQVVGAGALVLIVKGDHHRIALTGNAGVTDTLVSKLRAQVRSRRFSTLFNGRVHVDLKQEVHAAAKVKTEIHRQGVEL